MKKYKYNFMDKKPKNEKTLAYRKVFILVDNKDKPILHSGVMYMFYKSKEAKKHLEDCKNYDPKESEKWKVIKIQAHLMRL